MVHSVALFEEDDVLCLSDREGRKIDCLRAGLVLAKRADQDEDHKTDAEEASFRYPGPKPQSRETAVMMIADAVESASRTIDEPTPKRLRSLVHDMTMKRLLDGQFDECGLTLKELALIKDSLAKSLTAVYHGRVKYPDQQTA